MASCVRPSAMAALGLVELLERLLAGLQTEVVAIQPDLQFLAHRFGQVVGAVLQLLIKWGSCLVFAALRILNSAVQNAHARWPNDRLTVDTCHGEEQDKETRRQGDKESQRRPPCPCLLVSLSTCLLVWCCPAHPGLLSPMPRHPPHPYPSPLPWGRGVGVRAQVSIPRPGRTAWKSGPQSVGRPRNLNLFVHLKLGTESGGTIARELNKVKGSSGAVVR